MKNNIKYVVAFIAMVSLGASAFTSITGWEGTPFEYNAYLQGAVAGFLFIWLAHKAISATEVKMQKAPTNARDNRSK